MPASRTKCHVYFIESKSGLYGGNERYLPLESGMQIFSFSKQTFAPFPLRFRTAARLSTMFFANRLADLATIRGYLLIQCILRHISCMGNILMKIFPPFASVSVIPFLLFRFFYLRRFRQSFSFVVAYIDRKQNVCNKSAFRRTSVCKQSDLGKRIRFHNPYHRRAIAGTVARV